MSDPDNWTNIYAQPAPVPTPIMMGPQGARRLITEFLQTELPPLYDKMTTIWGLEDQPWQPPTKYYDYEVSRLNPDEFPVVVVTVPNSGRLVPDSMDFVTGDPVFRSEYPVRVFNWVRTRGVDTCMRMRDFQATAIRIALTTKGLAIGGSAIADAPYLATLLHETFSEEYSEVVGHTGSTYIAGSYVTFTLAATERASSTVLADLVAAPNGGWDVTIEAHGSYGAGRSVYPIQ